MKQLIIVVLIVATVGFVAVKYGKVKTDQVDFEREVTMQLDKVDMNNHEQIRDRLIAEAKKFDFDLKPKHILIDYVPTSDTKYSQKLVGNIASFENWRATIQFDYTAYILGFATTKHVAVSAIKQVRIQQKVRPELEEALKDY